jgi:iron complex outermembrane receptor protein
VSREPAVLILCGVLGLWPLTAGAQPAPVRVTVRVRAEDHRPVEGAAVKSGGAHAATDATGSASLQLDRAEHAITIVRLGFLPDTLRVVLQADTTLDATLREGAIEIAPVTISSTRAERRIEDEPERVEVLAGEDVTEKALTRPGDVTTLVKEIAGVRPQTTQPATGASGLRMQGLRAQYSAILLDGLPLHGTRGTGLGLLQIPPLDVQQAEVIKGAATALYGPSALSGVLDIVTRRPGDAPERTGLLNLTTRSGGDASAWLSRKFNERWGATFLGGAHVQQLKDVNHDGWADLPGYSRVELRPRFFWSGEGGRSAVITVGTTLENREGGGDGDFRQHADTRHGDAGASARLPMGSAGVLVFRGAWSGDWQKLRQFDPVLGATPLRDEHQTGFAEATYLHSHGAIEWLAGAAFELDDYANRDLPGLDYRYTTPAALGQLTWTAATWLSASAATRVDAHNRYGTRMSPRLSVLAHKAHALEARLSAGEGFHAPTPFTEESEALPLTRLRPALGLDAERAQTLSLDLTARRTALEVNATGFVSKIERPVLLAEPPDSAFASLVNAPGPTRTYGFETYAFYDKDPITVTANYSYLHSTEHDPESGLERALPLAPRHGAGLDVALEDDESHARVGVEIFYTGTQSLDHDPYRTSSVPYATIGILAAKEFGLALVYVNAENLADVRQAHYEPMLLPSPTAVGRLTVDAWAPQEGRTVNGGVRLSF